MQRIDPAPELQLNERRWLLVLASRLPLPVRFGEPSERFPKYWNAMTRIPGEPLDHGSISRGNHAAKAQAGSWSLSLLSPHLPLTGRAHADLQPITAHSAAGEDHEA